MAVGAQRHHILIAVLARTAMSVGAGIGCGLLLSLGVHHWLSHWMKGTGNPGMLLSATLILFIVALLACIVPAMRASIIDPAKALRTE
jgi:ABC-type antimicrobial peptide transport system permease subunit